MRLQRLPLLAFVPFLALWGLPAPSQGQENTLDEAFFADFAREFLAPVALPDPPASADSPGADDAAPAALPLSADGADDAAPSEPPSLEPTVDEGDTGAAREESRLSDPLEGESGAGEGALDAPLPSEFSFSIDALASDDAAPAAPPLSADGADTGAGEGALDAPPPPEPAEGESDTGPAPDALPPLDPTVGESGAVAAPELGEGLPPAPPFSVDAFASDGSAADLSPVVAAVDAPPPAAAVDAPLPFADSPPAPEEEPLAPARTALPLPVHGPLNQPTQPGAASSPAPKVNQSALEMALIAQALSHAAEEAQAPTPALGDGALEGAPFAADDLPHALVLEEEDWPASPNGALRGVSAPEAIEAQALPVMIAALGGTLRLLDKVTGEVVDLAMASGETRRYGRIVVRLGECRYLADNPSFDAQAHVSVRDDLFEEPVFFGWMIASSPALSALDHPRYDVWVLSCDLSGLP